MNTRPESSKLVALRSKTDRQLVAFITSRLDTGLNCALLVADRGNHDNWVSAESFQVSAERAYDEVRALLPWVTDVTQTERGQLESKLEQLRELLDEFSIHAGMRVQTACS